MPQEPTRKPSVESKAPNPKVNMSKKLQILLESVKWNLGGREGPGPRDKGYKGSPDIGVSLRKLIMPEKEVPPDPFDVKANAAQPVSYADVIPEYVERKTGSQLAGFAAGMVTPSISGKARKVIPEGWKGEKITSELGDTTITLSAKNPEKVQVTRWDGRAGTSNTVSDELFDSVEEAKEFVRKQDTLPIDDAQKGAEMATDMLHTTPAGAIAGEVKKVAPRVINSIYPFMPGGALKDTKYVQRNVRDPKELEHILETGYMLPKEGGKSQKYFTAVDEVNPVTPKGNTMLRIKREKVLPDEAVRAEDVEVFDFAKNLWKPLRETAPTVQTGRHTQ